MQPTDFKERLGQELRRRQERNPRYSLRAFARLLGTDHSTLSQVLRGARRPPVSQIPAWAEKLGIAREETAIYVSSEIIAPAANDRGQERLRYWIWEAMSIVTETAHWEILRRTREPGFRPDTRWIARQSRLAVDQVNMAFDRLLRLGLIESGRSGEWKDLTGPGCATEAEFRKLAIEQVCKKAAEASVDFGVPG